MRILFLDDARLRHGALELTHGGHGGALLHYGRVGGRRPHFFVACPAGTGAGSWALGAHSVTEGSHRDRLRLVERSVGPSFSAAHSPSQPQ